MTCILQCHYTVEEDSEGDNDSEEFYYGGQVCMFYCLFICILFAIYQEIHFPTVAHDKP